MILTFSQRRFEQRIISGIKRTTIRTDAKGRWKPGRIIHFWMHNPRNVSKNPYFFALGRCINVEDIAIYPGINTIVISTPGSKLYYQNTQNLNEIAKLDGFDDWEDMKTRFKTDFTGKRITFELHTIFL
ncbi:MAG: ASCH domain-containing protein [Paludibacteraceae bacterium]